MQLFKNDAEAAQALKAGNMQALEYFYNCYQQPASQFLKTYCRDQVLAEEMVQDAFLQLWENRAKINAERSVKNFLFTIAKNKATDQLRKTQHREKIFQLQLNDQPQSYSTLDQVILADYQKVLSGVLLRLPVRNQEIFHLSRTTQLSNAEISAQLNISVKAVEKQITKTLHFLRIFLSKQQILTLLILFHLFF